MLENVNNYLCFIFNRILKFVCKRIIISELTVNITIVETKITLFNLILSSIVIIDWLKDEM